MHKDVIIPMTYFLVNFVTWWVSRFDNCRSYVLPLRANEFWKRVSRKYNHLSSLLAAKDVSSKVLNGEDGRHAAVFAGWKEGKTRKLPRHEE